MENHDPDYKRLLYLFTLGGVILYAFLIYALDSSTLIDRAMLAIATFIMIFIVGAAIRTHRGH